MSVGAALASLRAMIPSVGSQTAEFVGMQGSLARVNIGDSTVDVPCVGYQPPIPGMIVQVEHRDGRYVVTGPSVTPVSSGVVTAVGSPLLTVEVDGVSHSLPSLSSYSSPAVNDQIEVDWGRADGGLVVGKITTKNTPPAPTPKPSGEGQAFSGLLVRAVGSGKFQSSWWGNDDPWASASNDGAWFYGSRIRDALKGAEVTRVEIFLPLIQKLNAAFAGTHPHASRPGGAPSISNLTPLTSRDGWVGLPVAFGEYLRDNTGGVGVTTGPGTGFNKWRGVSSDPLSGALRFSGVR